MPNSDFWIVFKTKKEGNAPKEVADDLKELKSGLTGAVEGLTGMSLSSLGVAGALTGLGIGMKKVIDSAIEAEAIQADLNATLKSTQGAAGLSADEINRMAARMSNLTGIEDDTIVKSQAMLLTFTNIGRDVFPLATQAMLNMSAKFGSLESASVQLGKALNDPVNGVTALRKVGVQLSDAQEAQIKKFVEMGNIAEAQKVILGELETEFGGLAEAMGDTTQGKINKFNNSIGNLGETLGGIFLPVIGFAADALNNMLTAQQKVADAMYDTDAAARKAAPSFEEYVLQAVAGRLAAQGTAKSVEELRKEFEKTPRDLDDVARGLGLITRNAFDTERSLQATELAAKEAASAALIDAQAYSDAHVSMDEFGSSVGASGLALHSFDKILEAQKAQLDFNKLAMTEYSTQLLYNQAAAGLDGQAQLLLAQEMGLVKESTVVASELLRAMTEQMNRNYVDTGAYTQQVAALDSAIKGLQSRNIVVTTRMVTIYESYNADEEGRYAEVHYAGGGQYTVPAGYNENWPVGPGRYASSNEVVTITPAGGTPPSGASSSRSDGPLVGTVILNNGMDMDLFLAKLARAVK